MTKEESLQRLKDTCPIGTTILVVQRTVTSSGSTMDFYALAQEKNGRMFPAWIGSQMATAGMYKINKKEHLVQSGRGYEHAVEVVEKLSKDLHGNTTALFCSYLA